MKAKSLTITFASIVVVLLLAMASMAIVWAATSQTIGHQLSITYEAKEIAGSIVVNKYFNSDIAVETKTVSFDGTTTETTGTLTTTDVALENDVEGENNKRFVIFEYVITNDSEDNDMSVSLTGTLTLDNVVATKSSGSQIASPFTTEKGASPSITSTLGAAPYFNDTVAAGDTKCFYIKIALDNLANDASCTGGLSWYLTKATA